jgi:hypothetical protein
MRAKGRRATISILACGLNAARGQVGRWLGPAGGAASASLCEFAPSSVTQQLPYLHDISVSFILGLSLRHKQLSPCYHGRDHVNLGLLSSPYLLFLFAFHGWSAAPHGRLLGLDDHWSLLITCMLNRLTTSLSFSRCARQNMYVPKVISGPEPDIQQESLRITKCPGKTAAN